MPAFYTVLVIEEQLMMTNKLLSLEVYFYLLISRSPNHGSTVYIK